MAERRYPVLQRKVPTRFTVSALRRVHNNDESRLKDALNEKEADTWREVKKKEVQNFIIIKFWRETRKPIDQKVLHRKFVWKRTQNCNGNIDSYKALLD